MRSRTPSLLLVGMALAGPVYASAGQSALAHNFSGDESVKFISAVENAKVHLQLASKNLRNSEAALDHIGSASMHFDKHVLKEIAEKNERIAKDLPAAFGKIKTMVLVKSSAANIKKQIGLVNGLLGEAISARIDRAQQRNGDVQAMAFAQMVRQALQAYEHASGAMAEERGNATPSSGHSHSSSGHDKAGVHDKQAHETSKAFVSKASTMYSKVKRLAPKDSANEMAKVKAGLAGLRNAFNHHEPVDKVTVIVHGKIHDNLIKAFDLQLPAEEEEKDHGHEEGGLVAG